MNSIETRIQELEKLKKYQARISRIEKEFKDYYNSLDAGKLILKSKITCISCDDRGLSFWADIQFYNENGERIFSAIKCFRDGPAPITANEVIKTLNQQTRQKLSVLRTLLDNLPNELAGAE